MKMDFVSRCILITTASTIIYEVHGVKLTTVRIFLHPAINTVLFPTKNYKIKYLETLPVLHIRILEPYLPHAMTETDLSLNK